MSKASIICHSCGQDNDPFSTFCIECGTSFTPPDSDKSGDPEGQRQPTEQLIEPENPASTYQPKSRSSDRMMMMGMKPMFMMPIMMAIMVLIFLFFISDIEMPFGN